MSEPEPVLVTQEMREERDAKNTRALLEPDLPQGLIGVLQECRPFSAATLALMSQTKNEWLRKIKTDEMDNHYFATLSWLYIQSAPENEVRKNVWDISEFRTAVLEWGERKNDLGKPIMTPEILAAADAIIQHSIGLIEDAQFSVEEKPGSKPDREPPNL